MSRKSFIFLMILCFVVAACATGTTLPNRVYPFFSEYKSKPAHKAFAITHDHFGGYSAVYVKGKSSPEIAQKDALDYCKERAKERNYVDPDKCFIYAVDDEIIGIPQVAQPTLPGGGIEGH